ncbi:mandelate racemase/muconate lactonizing enzyme family protein [Lampropedia aestuarii]|uniref:mandelate racemase/muconate lactonizing enzyme family protein n=1 Tax=Lampropedia aestuarii TaxID=2562762 RepID=UPI0024692BBB|nr:mandelate racemase/muconate lactonizing enzyme family protein [Lampropedia aestuarii]MDH5857811.1 mandelate racemase/muconate lactonizing enzyme family protein [Lampropedia aestuarii]
MKIERIETLSCDAGWRNYNFLKITADDGTVGWSEFDEAFGPPGLTAVIERLGARLIGLPARLHEQVYTTLMSPLRPMPYGMSTEALGAFENALLDLKAKSLGIPCHELLGGKQRSEVPIYWSHCASWRINHPHLYSPAIDDLDGVKAAGAEACAAGFSAVKTNLFIHGDGKVRQWMPGFGAPSHPGLTVDTKLLKSFRAHLEALREGAGPDVEVMVDLNFNGRTEGFMKLIRALEKDFPFFWIELDSYNPAALAYIRQQSHSPIAALETLFGVRQYLPYFQAQSVDVAIIDAVWNGVWQSMKIANAAEAFDVNIAPHNFYSHLATMMNVHFAAAVPNLRVMEHDMDRLPWDDELFTSAPQIRNGAIVVPDAPGWGIEPKEDALKKHPAKEIKGYLGL